MNKMRYDICFYCSILEKVEFLWIFMILIWFSGICACQVCLFVVLYIIALASASPVDGIFIHYAYASLNVYFDKPSLILFVNSIFFIIALVSSDCLKIMQWVRCSGIATRARINWCIKIRIFFFRLKRCTKKHIHKLFG